MKDVLKIFGLYFALGFGTITGIRTGLKVCDKLLENKEKKNKVQKGTVIKLVKESE